MGSSHSKTNDLKSNFLKNLQLKPYCFIGSSEIKSSSSPTLIKTIVKPTQPGAEHNLPPRPDDRTYFRRYAGATSLVFLRNERYLVFGTIHLDVDHLNSKEIWQEFTEKSCDFEDNLCKVDILLDKMMPLVSYSVRDISLSGSTDYLAFLTFQSHNYLQVWKFSDESNLDCVEILDDKYSTYHLSCCAFSPDFKWLVTTANSDYFTLDTKNHLEVYPINCELRKLEKKKIVYIPVCRHQDRGFLISLDFSPDSKILAVGCSEEKVFLLSTETWKVISVAGRSEEFNHYYGLFHPFASSYEFFLCTWNGSLQKWNTKPLYKKDKSVRSSELELVDIMDNKDTLYGDESASDDDDEAIVHCPQFSPNGEMLAIPYSNGKVLIVDTNRFKTLWTIWTNFKEIVHSLALPQIMYPSSVTFSKSCEYLAIGYARQFVAVWLLPRSHFSLKHLCRTKIISNCPPNSISDLPIPDSLKMYLLYQA